MQINCKLKYFKSSRNKSFTKLKKIVVGNLAIANNFSNQLFKAIIHKKNT